MTARSSACVDACAALAIALVCSCARPTRSEAPSERTGEHATSDGAQVEDQAEAEDRDAARVPTEPVRVSDVRTRPVRAPYCADAEQPGLIYTAAICGNTLSSCRAHASAYAPALTRELGPSLVLTGCSQRPQSQMEQLYCFNDLSNLVCTGIEMFCQTLSEQGPDTTACVKYGRQDSSQGPPDKDPIRRIVRSHIDEVRACYNQGLSRDPNLTGRVAVQFTIDPNGDVPIAAVESSTVPDRQTADCIVEAVKRWTFPKPQSGGKVVVTYPFVLQPG